MIMIRLPQIAQDLGNIQSPIFKDDRNRQDFVARVGKVAWEIR